MYVVGYPKSGNTWLCFLLAYCLNAEYDDLDAPGIHPQQEYQRRYVKGGLAHPSYQTQLGQIWKTHHPKRQEMSSSQPIVYLLRDGRDVMVSYFFYQRKIALNKDSAAKNWFQKLGNLVTHDSTNQNYYENFSSFLQQHTDQWVTHVSTWLERNPQVIVRYEDLKTEPEATLNKVFQQLHVEVAPAIIQQALEIFDFKQLSQRKEGEEDRSSFFRKGIAGDWKNHFSRDDLEFFQAKAAKVMNQAGYSLAED
jgi:hypothetical protein